MEFEYIVDVGFPVESIVNVALDETVDLIVMGMTGKTNALEKVFGSVSIPKIAILLAAMDALEKGEPEETAVIKEDLNSMICRSNNQAYTRMTRFRRRKNHESSGGGFKSLRFFHIDFLILRYSFYNVSPTFSKVSWWVFLTHRFIGVTALQRYNFGISI